MGYLRSHVCSWLLLWYVTVRHGACVACSSTAVLTSILLAGYTIITNAEGPRDLASVIYCYASECPKCL